MAGIHSISPSSPDTGIRLFHAGLLLAAASIATVHGALAASPPETPSVIEGFTTPFVAVPHAATPPVIDGIIDDAEWRHSASLNALRTVRGAVSARQARYWICWDREALYIAMRSPLREGERPLQQHRGESGDPSVVFDDSYEFFFDTGGTEAGGLPAYVQYIGNFAGDKYDATHLPTVGTRRMSYEAGWMPGNRLAVVDGTRVWEMEVRIPHASILVPEPFEDGFQFRALLARNFKRPWEQNSIEGTALFMNAAAYSRFRLSKTAPAIHLRAVADPSGNRIGLDLAASGPPGQRIHWRFGTDGGLRREGDMALDLDRLTPADTHAGLEPVPETGDPGHFRIQVLAPDLTTVWLDWAASRAIAGAQALASVFDDDRGDQATLSLSFNPIHNYLRVSGDFINFDARQRIAACRVAVRDSAGNEIAGRTCALDTLAFVKDTVELPAIPPGDYVAHLTATDPEGRTILERETPFSRKDPAREFAWWNTPHGNIEKVIPPWTPVSAGGPSGAVWGRAMTVGAAGLPASIRTQERELLQAPCRLSASFSGAPALDAGDAAVEILSSAPHRAVFRAQSALGSLAVSSLVTLEFDGMYKVEMTLTPEAPVTVESLRLVVPFRPDAAAYVSACGEGIRWGYHHGFLPPARTGRLWDCRTVDGQRMTAGSFIPYVWVGNPAGGLCWFADSDQGWVPDNAQPAIEIRRDSDASTDLVFHLVSAPVAFHEPRTLVFAFQATPVKPLDAAARTRVYDFRDSFQEWQCGENRGSPRMQAPVPWTFDADECRDRVRRWHSGSRMLSIYRQPVIPYGRHNELFPRLMPEAAYFSEAWQAQGSWHLYYSKTLTDYWIHHLALWIESCDLDGYYSDNVHPAVCFNAEAGHAYRLPDGRVQPGYNCFGLRDYFLRLRAVFAEHGKQGWIVAHMTHNMVMPWIGACDIALDGEDHHIEPRQNRTWLDAWPLERLRADVPAQLGVAVTFKTEFTPAQRWSGGRYSFDQVWRSYVAGLLLHDAVPMSSYGSPTAWFAARDRFGMGEPDVRFIGYWQPDAGITCDHPDIRVSAWVRPQHALLAIVGTGSAPLTTASVRLDPVRLGLLPPSDWHVFDAEALATYAYLQTPENAVGVNETGKPALTMDPDGTLRVTVGRHDYRQIAIRPRRLPGSPKPP